MALIPCLYIGRSRAASSFSMPGSEAIFHGFVCAPSHRVELSLPASFMYSSLHCLYEVETTIHFRGWEVKKKFSGGKGLELGMRNESGGFAAILRLRSQLFWHSLSHIRRFSSLRMTKRGDARRSVDRRFSSYRQPSPRGEGAPKGRIGHRRYERQMRKAERCAAYVGERESLTANDND